jgi:hypothetical protein
VGRSTRKTARSKRRSVPGVDLTVEFSILIWIPHLSASCSSKALRSSEIGRFSKGRLCLVKKVAPDERMIPLSFMSTSLLDPILFNIRSLRVLSLGITEVAGPLFLFDNAIFGQLELIADQWNLGLGR